MLKTKESKGITLIALIITIIVLLILAGVTISAISGNESAMEKATEAREKNDLANELEEIKLCVINAKLQNTINAGTLEERYLSEELTKIGANTVEYDTGFLVTVLSTGRKYTVTKTGMVTPNTNSWLGKTAVFVGDSITYGVGTEEGKRYWELLENELNLSSVTGMGISGSCISAQSDYGTRNTPLINRYNNIPNKDLIVVFMGTNDYGHETPLGTITDEEDISFYGALNVIIPALKEAHKNSRIVFVTPMHRYGFGKSNITGNSFTYDNVKNGVGYTLKDYVDAIKEVCDSYSIPVIDLFSVDNLDPSNVDIKNKYFPDGLHPNSEGHKIMANLLKDNFSIIQPINDSGLDSGNIEDIELQNGNIYNENYKNAANRVSLKTNIYVNANTTIRLKNSGYKYGIYYQSDSNPNVTSVRTLTGGWINTDYTIMEEGWYGIALCKDDDTDFNFTDNDSNDLADYIDF